MAATVQPMVLPRRSVPTSPVVRPSLVVGVPASRAVRLTPAQVASRKALLPKPKDEPPVASVVVGRTRGRSRGRPRIRARDRGLVSDSSDDDDDDESSSPEPRAVAGPATLRPMVVCADGNEAVCSLCGKGGVIVCCDGCPASFHNKCCKTLRRGTGGGAWRCPTCTVEGALVEYIAAFKRRQPRSFVQETRLKLAVDLCRLMGKLITVRCVCGCVAVWLCGCVAVWLCVCVWLWLCVCAVACWW